MEENMEEGQTQKGTVLEGASAARALCCGSLVGFRRLPGGLMDVAPGRHFGSLCLASPAVRLAARWPLLRAARSWQVAVRALRGGEDCAADPSLRTCAQCVPMLADLGPGIPGVSTTQSLGLVVLRHLGMHLLGASDRASPRTKGKRLFIPAWLGHLF